MSRLHDDPSREYLRQRIELARSSAASRQAHRGTGRLKTRSARKASAMKEW